MNKLSIKDLCMISLLTAIIFVQEQLLTNIAGLQLTVFLIVLYSKKLGLLKTTIIIIIHVLLDNLYMSSLSFLYTPTMLIGWTLIPITLCTVFKKVESNIILALLGLIYSFIYCWLFIIPNMIIMDINPIAYLISDITYEVVLAVVSFLSILWLYKPCSKIFEMLDNKN